MNRADKIDGAPFYSHVSEGPADVSAYWIYADDNVRLRVAHWKIGADSKGTVFLFQGRTENIEKYGRTAEVTHKAGYDSFAIDWRGQGLSDRLTDDRMIGHVRHFSDYQKDVAAMLDAANYLELPKPWYILGHSLGACIGLRLLLRVSRWQPAHLRHLYGILTSLQLNAWLRGLCHGQLKYWGRAICTRLVRAARVMSFIQHLKKID